MSKHKSRLRVMAFAAAAAMLFCGSFTACTPTGPTGPTDEWAVTLDFNDDASTPRTVYVDKEGGSVEEPADPVLTGYTFKDWNTQEDGSGDTIAFPYTPTGDITLYAQWDVRQYTVTFDAGEGLFPDGDETKSVQAAYASTIPADQIPESPVRDEKDPETGETIYTFREWRTAAGDSVDLATWTVPAEDTTLTAAYRSIYTRIVTLDLQMGDGYRFVAELERDGEDSLRDRDVVTAAGERVTNTGAYPGYRLAGWSTDPDAQPGEESVIETDDLFPINYEDLTGDVTYYAVWEMQEYTATFIYNYAARMNEVYDTISGLTVMDTVTPPETDPERPGYTFAGWYTQSYGGSPVDFASLRLTAHGTYYAHWTSIPVETDTFHAEYIDLTQQVNMPGYSGANSYTAVIVTDSKGSGAAVDNDYRLDGVSMSAGIGRFVSYQYRYGATLEFRINSDRAVSGATLYANLAMEIFGGITIGPDGENKVAVYVNATAVNYSPINFGGTPGSVEQNWVSPFQEYQLGNVDLVEGENIVRIVVENNTPLGGTMAATSFITDYIRIDTHGGATLSWSPIYDNVTLS